MKEEIDNQHTIESNSIAKLETLVTWTINTIQCNWVARVYNDPLRQINCN